MIVTKDKLLTILYAHIGKKNGITALNLAEYLDTYARQVRTLITELRLDGVAICGKPETGYYIAETSEELEETCQFIHSRAMHSLLIVSRLRKVPLADLVGQMRLKT